MNRDGLSITQNGVIIWSNKGIISNDYVAGTLVGARNILLDRKDNNKYDANIKDEHVSFDLLNNQKYVMTMTDYILDSAKEDDIINRRIINYPMGTSLGWWIQKSSDGEYYLYMFGSSDFIQGFIDICDFFEVDFRDYILGTPFIYNDQTKMFEYYYITGYDVEPIPLPIADAQVGAFYTGSYENSNIDYES